MTSLECPFCGETTRVPTSIVKDRRTSITCRGDVERSSKWHPVRRMVAVVAGR